MKKKNKAYLEILTKSAGIKYCEDYIMWAKSNYSNKH